MLKPENEDLTVNLEACLAEIERYAGRFGWDQPAKLFAIVPTARLLAAEPSLRSQLVETVPGGYSSVEQEFLSGSNLLDDLAAISWPPTVDGCALVVERCFLTREYEADIPQDEIEAADFVANHPYRQDLRIVAGALRTGQVSCVARLRTNPGEIMHGDMAPALTTALACTLK
uniref:PPA1309 family protein n=1 Tax=Vaginimicrobium propionicum TaxID=1871034 RepID=UPI001E3335B2|nr:PPA1309 family protein [Vaginimicrobium propionicum]